MSFNNNINATSSSSFSSSSSSNVNNNINNNLPTPTSCSNVILHTLKRRNTKVVVPLDERVSYLLFIYFRV